MSTLVIDSIFFFASVTQKLPAEIDMHLTSEDSAAGLIGLAQPFPGINGNGCSHKISTYKFAKSDWKGILMYKYKYKL